jgi:hypothetical protein
LQRWILARLRHHQFFSLRHSTRHSRPAVVWATPFKLDGCRRSMFDDRPAGDETAAADTLKIRRVEEVIVNIATTSFTAHYYSIP